MDGGAAIAVVGGSGFAALDGAEVVGRHEVTTPYGAPSAAITELRLDGRRVLFVPRHGSPHRLLPHEVNPRANLHALKQLGATVVVSVSAVGSLRAEIAPGHAVVPRQMLDRTTGRPRTFFGDGIVGHISLADPVCDRVADQLAACAAADGGAVHPTGTYACVDGPRFGTRAESHQLRVAGADVVGMTNMPEAALAREAELCWVTLALPTDYDAWRERDEVSAVDAVAVLGANVRRARGIVGALIAGLDPAAPCRCQRALDTALFTPPEAISPEASARLAPLLRRWLVARGAT